MHIYVCKGLCGGCWAFVSAGCVEASVAKNSDRSVLLSVQELIDCDVEYDKGCSGGNPINAFRYVIYAYIYIIFNSFIIIIYFCMRVCMRVGTLWSAD